MLSNATHTYFESFPLKAKNAGPHVVIMAGVHGDEFEPMLAAMNLVKKLPSKLLKGKVTIVPVANVSAFTLATRCAEDGLDLARTMPGKKNGSHSQKLAHALSLLIKTADYLIDLHTGGSLFDILPLSGYLLHPSKPVLKKQQQMARAFNLPIIWGTDAHVRGRTLSVAKDYNIPAIYAECRGGLVTNKNTIKAYEEGCLNVLDHLGLMKLNNRQKEKNHTWLEDHTPGQGHLQIKLPAAEPGIFIPAVSLGKKIKKDSLLGYIVNPLLHRKTVVRAPEEGLVFMLRIHAKVQAGDSLGGILPVSGKGKKLIYEK